MVPDIKLNVCIENVKSFNDAEIKLKLHLSSDVTWTEPQIMMSLRAERAQHDHVLVILKGEDSGHYSFL